MEMVGNTLDVRELINPKIKNICTKKAPIICNETRSGLRSEATTWDPNQPLKITDSRAPIAKYNVLFVALLLTKQKNTRVSDTRP